MKKNNYFKGFLKAEGTKIINDAGEEVILTGWGIGNWLLCEGYMWLAGGISRMDRPYRIEQVVKELVGTEKANEFWRNFRTNYIQESDIAHMKSLGYNSVRIPFNWRLFLQDEPGIAWKEEGFLLLDRCLEWCEKHEIYAFLDMHGAPGGQTGTNIDDSIDDVPRLFIDKDKWEKGIVIWEELAKRYKDNQTVGGYDLLNEPIRPAYGNDLDYTYLLPKLSQFYDEAITAIRKHDKDHMLSIEGHHWSTDLNVFHKKHDDNMVIHFHRYGKYGEFPQRTTLDKYIKKSRELNVPLWMGETGENKLPWYSAYFQLAQNYGIGYNLWPYKKMGAKNCPCLITPPKDWDLILDYAKGGGHPGFEKAESILSEYLENLKFENNVLLPEITNFVFRQSPFFIRATDFDESPSRDDLYSGNSEENNVYQLRDNTGIRVIEEKPPGKLEFRCDTQWDRFVIELQEKDYVTYTANKVNKDEKIQIECTATSSGILRITQNYGICQKIHVSDENKDKVEVIISESGSLELRIECVHGKVQMRKIIFG